MTPQSFRPTYLLLLVLLVLSSTGCEQDEPPIGPSERVTPGQTEFSNEEPENAGTSFNNFGPDAPLASADAGGRGTLESAAPAPGAPSGREGTVEEADIYRVDNNRLFYLNTYRGFIIYDVNNPKAPKRISRLPVYGYPVEMFIEGSTVYALLRDALYLTQKRGELRFERHNVSQLVTIDISDLENPRILKRIDITGELREGVSRKIEDTIYVVSSIPQYYHWGWGYGRPENQQEQAWVYSFNVGDPEDPQLVEKLKIFEGGSYNNEGDCIRGFCPAAASENRSFSGLALSATSNALMVVENWQTYSYSNEIGRCGNSESTQQALVSVVDISDPAGDIRLHTRFETRGQLTDQFKQTYVFDEATQKGTYVGIFARNEWSSENCSGGRVIRNTLESWDVTDGDKPTQLDAVTFGKEDETVRGSAFDPERKVVYAITARQIDPLYAISYADPSNLEVLSEIDGLSGDMNVFRLIGDNRYLIGIGRDNSSTCTGFADPGETGGWRSTNIAVSIIDVRNVDAIRLVQRECVAVQNAEWVGSSLNWNLDQAHKMIGMHSDSRANVITVPIYYYARSSDTDDWWWYRRQTAVGVMSWDLAKYDDTKDETQQSVLQNFGTIIHPEGEVKRSAVFTHRGETDRRMVINLSDTHLSIADIDDLSRPVPQSVVEVAPYVQQLFRFGDYLVEQTGNGGFGYYFDGGQRDKAEFRIKKAGEGRLDDAPVVASFAVGQIQRVVKHGDKLVLFRYVQDAVDPGRFGYDRSTDALIYDLSDPTAPKRLSSVRLPRDVMPYYRFWCGTGDYWGGYAFGQQNNWVDFESGLAFLTHRWDDNFSESKRILVYLDLSDAADPKVSETELGVDGKPATIGLIPVGGDSFYETTSRYTLGLVPDGADRRGFYINYKLDMVRNGNESELRKVQYWAERWAPQDGKLTSGKSLNTPGQLLRTYARDGETLFLTQDASYTRERTDYGHNWRPTFRLHLLRALERDGRSLAELLDSQRFNDLHLQDLVISDGRLVLNARKASHYYLYDAVEGDSSDWRDFSDQLIIFDLSKHHLDETFRAPTATYNAQLMGTYKDELFVNLPGDGVLALNLKNPGNPFGTRFLRTLGYASHIEFAKGTAYVASGNFGVFEFGVGGPVVIPTR